MGDTSLCIIGQRNINGSQNNRDHFHCSYLPLRTRRYKTQDPIAEGTTWFGYGTRRNEAETEQETELVD